MATIRELGFCNLNARVDFQAIKHFFQHEEFDDRFLAEEMELTEILFPPPAAEELQATRQRITRDYDVRRAAMYLKLLRYSYSSGKKSFASQPFDLRRLFGLIQQLENRLATVVIENQDFETLIHHYDRPDTFFYLDPPYFSTEDMYAVEFAWGDHVRLRDTAAAMQGKFLLSYNDCSEIRELYEGFPIGRIIQYGYTGNIDPDWVSQSSAGADKLSHVYATQLLIWETIVGERDENFAHVSTGGKNATLEIIKSGHPLRSRILDHYNSMVTSVQNHSKVPSFMAKSRGKAPTIELEWDGSQYIQIWKVLLMQLYILSTRVRL